MAGDFRVENVTVTEWAESRIASADIAEEIALLKRARRRSTEAIGEQGHYTLRVEL